MWSSLALALSLVCLLFYSLPDYLPGKRAAAILLLLYHGVVSSVLLNADSIVDFAFPERFAKHGVRLESIFGVAHGILSLMTVSWWQASLGSVQAYNAAGAGGGVAVKGKAGGKRK